MASRAASRRVRAVDRGHQRARQEVEEAVPGRARGGIAMADRVVQPGGRLEGHAEVVAVGHEGGHRPDRRHVGQRRAAAADLRVHAGGQRGGRGTLEVGGDVGPEHGGDALAQGVGMDAARLDRRDRRAALARGDGPVERGLELAVEHDAQHRRRVGRREQLVQARGRAHEAPEHPRLVAGARAVVLGQRLGHPQRGRREERRVVDERGEQRAGRDVGGEVGHPRHVASPVASVPPVLAHALSLAALVNPSGALPGARLAGRQRRGRERADDRLREDVPGDRDTRGARRIPRRGRRRELDAEAGHTGTLHRQGCAATGTAPVCEVRQAAPVRAARCRRSPARRPARARRRRPRRRGLRAAATGSGGHGAASGRDARAASRR